MNPAEFEKNPHHFTTLNYTKKLTGHDGDKMLHKCTRKNLEQSGEMEGGGSPLRLLLFQSSAKFSTVTIS